MIGYTPLAEKRMKEWKGWYSPDTGYFRQFDPNMVHGEIAYQELRMSEAEALKKGYYRIYVGHEVVIHSWDLPTDREFQAVKYMIEANSYKKFDGTRWGTETNPGYYYFPKISFLLTDSFKNAEHKKR